MEGLDFDNASDIEVTPAPVRYPNTVDVRAQTTVLMEEIPLITDNEKAKELLRAVRELGYSPDEVKQGMEELDPVPTTKQAERKAKQDALDMNVKNETGRILRARGINPMGKDLDKQRRGRENFVVLKSTIDRHINQSVGKGEGKRPDLSRTELDAIEAGFAQLLANAERDVFGG